MEQGKLGTELLDEAVCIVLDQMGIEVLGNASLFEASMLDVYQSDSATARVFFRNCDDELLAPYSRAVAASDITTELQSAT